MGTGVAVMIIIVGMVIILNLFIFLKRILNADRRKGKGRNYVPPSEAQRAQWRDKEIARRIENEQNEALERVNLRNATLAYYEAVKARHEKIDALKRMGIEVDESKIDEAASLSLDEYLNIR